MGENEVLPKTKDSTALDVNKLSLCPQGNSLFAIYGKEVGRKGSSLWVVKERRNNPCLLGD